ncbi:MAG: U32 family peptidase, partial [Clostridia bacterium]|nr:U32 family peptidase [Clostridia bacterium]
MKKLPELLAPVGSEETLGAAIKAGADAVYLGGKLYNARMNAKNFDSDGIKRAVELCHSNGVRLYITLNTLIYDRNFKDALKYAEELYKSGVDALITADVGLSRTIKKELPDFELHASTQMTGHNVAAAEYLAEMGFSRMVCAREMSKNDINELVKKSPIEIEMFIHGAMCVCQSGQCLMSSFIGNRSGNRGECAQPCRLPYNNGYPISLKDMCLANHVKELIDMGVASLKIEGRMKSPSYVYSVVSTYRKLLDENRNATPKEIEKLASVFSRGGFSDGYFVGKIDNNMLGIRSSTDKEATKNTSVKMNVLDNGNKPIEN